MGADSNLLPSLLRSRYGLGETKGSGVVGLAAPGDVLVIGLVCVTVVVSVSTLLVGKVFPPGVGVIVA